MVAPTGNPGAELKRHSTRQGGEMTSNDRKFDDVVAELREQGLTVKVHSVLNETWYIKDHRDFSGYIASGAEMLELKRANKLNIPGIK